MEITWVMNEDTTTDEWIEKLAHLFNRVLLTDDSLGYPGPIPHEQALALARARANEVRAGRLRMMLGAVDGKPVFEGVLSVNTAPNIQHLAYVERTMVDADYRGLKLVSSALRTLIEVCEQSKIELVHFAVRRGTVAELAWRHFGFRELGVLPGAVRCNGATHDVIYMYDQISELKKRIRPR